MIRVLRILSGLHTNAHIKLTEGDWLLGSDPLCDILLSDLAPQQGIVRVEGDGTVFFIPHKEEDGITQNTVEEEHIPEEGALIPLYTCVTLGTIYIALGEDTSTWPHITLPHEKKKSSENSDTTAPSIPASQESVPLQNTANIPPSAPLELTPPPHKGKKIFVRLLLLLLVLTLTLGGIWTVNRPPIEEKERQDIESVVEALLVEMSPAYTYGTAPFRIEKTQENVWHVCGAVQSDVLQERMQTALQGLPFTVTSAITVVPEAAQNLENHIKTQGALLHTQAMQQGLRISGYIYDKKILEALLSPLQKDLQCLSLQENVVFWAQIQSAVAESLQALALQHVVHIQAGPYGLIVSYQPLSTENKEKLQTFLQEVQDMTRGVSPFIKIASAQQSAPQAMPKLAPKKEDTSTGTKSMNDFCQYIAIDGQGAQLYIVYEKKHFLRGATLPNGLQVQEITEKYATFTLDERLLYCPR